MFTSDCFNLDDSFTDFLVHTFHNTLSAFVPGQGSSLQITQLITNNSNSLVLLQTIEAPSPCPNLRVLILNRDYSYLSSHQLTKELFPSLSTLHYSSRYFTFLPVSHLNQLYLYCK